MDLFHQQKEHLNARVCILKAMAHPSRLFIIEQLQQQECCVCELTSMIGADISTISKHLSVLKNAGIVVDDKRGNQVFYQLRTPCLLNFFGCLDAVMETRQHGDKESTEMLRVLNK